MRAYYTMISRDTYIKALQYTYDFYTEGSRPLMLANQAVDAALAGKMKIKGDAWDYTMTAWFGFKNVTLKMLAALPDK